jgi:hypothetical protein
VATTVTILDQWAPGGVAHQWALDLLTGRMTVRELIRSRVSQEVTEYNARIPPVYHGLVQPTDAELTLNGNRGNGDRGYRVRTGARIDWEAHYRQALAAFQTNGFLLLVDGRQVTDLDDEVVVAPGTELTFLRLFPLMGG